MKYLNYFLRLIWHWIASGIYNIGKLLTNVPGLSSFSETLVASYAVGSSTQAIHKKDYLRAYKVLKPVENYETNESCIGTAQYNLAYLYIHGYGVEKDDSVALELMNKAANKGNPEAKKYLNELGNN
jgi:TPR repeat protein